MSYCTFSISDVTSEVFSDFTENQVDSFLNEFTPGKEANFSSSKTKYCCRTSTVPFCTTFNMLQFQSKEYNNSFKEYHGESDRHVGEHKCRFCMLKRKDGSIAERWIPQSCPSANCGHIQDREQLTPLCFLSFLKSLSPNLVPCEESFKPSEVMFCHDSRSILDNKYPLQIQRATGVSGWGHVTQANIQRVLPYLYWFNKNKRGKNTYHLESEVYKAIQRIGWRRFKTAFKQSLHTVNGLLIKKFQSFGPELVGYKALATQTAGVFRDLIREYSADAREDLQGPSLYEEMKDYFNFVKEWHGHKDYDKRTEFLDYKFQNASLGRFFGRELRALKLFILGHLSDGLGDYSESIAWDYRCITICQTRNIGYLPPFKKREVSKRYREIVSRRPASLSLERKNMIQDLVVKELRRAGIPTSYSKESEFDLNSIIEQSVRMELKPSANVDFTSSMGGNVEAARLLLQKARTNRWQAPVRCLESFKILSYTPRIRDDIKVEENVYNLSSAIFWFSLQNCINHLVAKGVWKNEKDYYPFIKKGGCEDNPKDHEIIENFMDAQIIDIDEGGKLRKLVKCNAAYNWMLAPGSKISQKVLAQMPDHTAGLEAGAHDWVFTKRIGGTSDESGFLYDRNGKIKDRSMLGYMDWTEATDMMWRRVGIAHLQSFFQYIKFPWKYGILIMTLIREPQRVKEIHQLTITPDGPERETIQWNGYIREGFPMGMRMTKTILHLAHVSERAFAETFLEQEGIKINRYCKNIDFRGKPIPYEEEGKLHSYKRAK